MARRRPQKPRKWDCERCGTKTTSPVTCPLCYSYVAWQLIQSPEWRKYRGGADAGQGRTLLQVMKHDAKRYEEYVEREQARKKRENSPESIRGRRR